MRKKSDSKRRKRKRKQNPFTYKIEITEHSLFVTCIISTLSVVCIVNMSLLSIQFSGLFIERVRFTPFSSLRWLFHCIQRKKNKCVASFLFLAFLCSFQFNSSIQIAMSYGNWDYRFVHRPQRVVFMHFQCVSLEYFKRVSFTRAHVVFPMTQRMQQESDELVDVHVDLKSKWHLIMYNVWNLSHAQEKWWLCSHDDIRMEFHYCNIK